MVKSAMAVIALGADYDMDATPGLAEGGNEFYSLAGAERLAGIIPAWRAAGFQAGRHSHRNKPGAPALKCSVGACSSEGKASCLS